MSCEEVDYLEMCEYDNSCMMEYTESENSSEMTLNRRTQKKLLEDYKKSDPSYYKYKKMVFIEKNEKENVKIEMYSTVLTPGNKIRDAITGIRYNERVGSINEDLYFKVRMTILHDPKNVITLFYNSPEEYERHQYVVLSDELKRKWRSKNTSALKTLQN